MPVSWRFATWNDIAPALQIERSKLGDTLVDTPAAMGAWKQIFENPFFASGALESEPPVLGHRLVGFGASVMIRSDFADAEIAHPRPDINSRIIASIHSGESVLAERSEVARANAGPGIDIVVLYGNWREEILSGEERLTVQNMLATSFAEHHAGYRIGRILHETATAATREFVEASIVFRPVGVFPEVGRVLHLMDRESVRSIRAHLGNALFDFREPMLHLRDSDQQLLLAALSGQTNAELAASLGVTLSAVKARWRSAFARIEEVMPDLAGDTDEREGRGAQKRHRVLTYIRNHIEELRPYDLEARSGNPRQSERAATA